MYVYVNAATYLPDDTEGIIGLGIDEVPGAAQLLGLPALDVKDLGR